MAIIAVDEVIKEVEEMFLFLIIDVKQEIEKL
jgi:hypothetical protein